MTVSHVCEVRPRAALDDFEHFDRVCLLNVRADGNARSDAQHANAERLDQFGKIDVNVPQDTVAGTDSPTIMTPLGSGRAWERAHHRPSNGFQ